MRNIIISVSLSVLAAVLICWGYSRYNNTKIGFIKSAIVLSEYKAMIQSTEQFNNELKIVQVNLDTLRNRYEALKSRESSITAKEKEKWSYRLGVAQTEYDKYNEQASAQMEARRNELTNKVLQTVNNFIQDYGSKNNYKFILGTTDNGSILYGAEGDDLTQVVLEELNRLYDERVEKTK